MVMALIKKAYSSQFLSIIACMSDSVISPHGCMATPLIQSLKYHYKPGMTGWHAIILSVHWIYTNMYTSIYIYTDRVQLTIFCSKVVNNILWFSILLSPSTCCFMKSFIATGTCNTLCTCSTESHRDCYYLVHDILHMQVV